MKRWVQSCAQYVSPPMMLNNVGKQFSTSICNRKILRNVIAILKQLSYCFINHWCTYSSLGTQIKAFQKLVSVTNRKLLASYRNWQRERNMFLYQVCLCFYLRSTAPPKQLFRIVLVSLSLSIVL